MIAPIPDADAAVDTCPGEEVLAPSCRNANESIFRGLVALDGRGGGVDRRIGGSLSVRDDILLCPIEAVDGRKPSDTPAAARSYSSSSSLVSGETLRDDLVDGILSNVDDSRRSIVSLSPAILNEDRR